MCVGLLKEVDLIKAAAHGVGNVLLVVGARTGRDGIHGASFASEELTRESARRRPQVQVGDPFTEKLLLEASLELIASGHIVAIQDMGAAGLTSSSAEMAAKGGGRVGVEIDLARVPTREPGMTPYEILLSESQERMLLVAKADRVQDVQAIAAKWELGATPIGRVTDDGLYRATWGEQVVVEIPAQRLIDDCPVYHPEAAEDPEIARRRASRPTPNTKHLAPDEVLLELLDHPPVASKRWVYEQYDSTVRARTSLFTARAPRGPWTRPRLLGWSGSLRMRSEPSRAMPASPGMSCSCSARPAPSWAGRCCGRRCTGSSAASRRAWISPPNGGSWTSSSPAPRSDCSARHTTAPRAAWASPSRKSPWAARTRSRASASMSTLRLTPYGLRLWNCSSVNLTAEPSSRALPSAGAPSPRWPESSASRRTARARCASAAGAFGSG